MNWEPSAQEIEEKLIEMAYIWGDIEEQMEIAASEAEAGPISDEQFLAESVGNAFRVEAIFDRNDFNDPCSTYLLLFDVADKSSRKATDTIERFRLRQMLSEYIRDHARPWHSDDHLRLKLVPRSIPIEGQVCRRLGEEHPPQVTPSLDDVPPYRPSAGSVELIERTPHWLTPIEAPFYDALRETGLTFAVQPWVEGPSGKYRLDFLVFYDGGAVGVELDGHEWHKTKEQRSRDAARDRWFQSRRIQIVRFTGSQVFADVQGCVSELLNVVRASQARP